MPAASLSISVTASFAYSLSLHCLPHTMTPAAAVQHQQPQQQYSRGTRTQQQHHTSHTAHTAHIYHTHLGPVQHSPGLALHTEHTADQLLPCAQSTQPYIASLRLTAHTASGCIEPHCTTPDDCHSLPDSAYLTPSHAYNRLRSIQINTFLTRPRPARHPLPVTLITASLFTTRRVRPAPRSSTRTLAT